MHIRRNRNKRKDVVVMGNLKRKNSNIVKHRKKFTLPQIFTKNKSNGKRRTAVNFRYLLIPVILFAFIALIYGAIRYITYIRGNAFNDENYIVGNVIGIENIPEYPGSEFMFKNTMDNSVVKEFISQGNSAYRLLVSTDTEDIEKYYKDNLPAKGWVLVSEVTIGTEDKKYGQYWTKDGKGLRIYSKFKDIWYENITEEEAKSALANRVQEEIEREMLMASSDKQDLLPDYPWKIQIPKEYIIKYSATGKKDLRAVSFQKLGSNDIIEIYPLSKIGSKELDYMLEDYCKVKSSGDLTYSVMNTVPTNFQEYISLKGTILSEKGALEVIMMQNGYNGTVYVMSSTKENDPLFGYILENIKPMGSN